VLSIILLLPHTAGLSGFHSEFAARPVPTVGGGKTPLVHAVYLVVVDGLRLDVSQGGTMPFLDQLRRTTAAWGKIRVGLPSYSRPGYARLLTGAPAELTGLTMNDQTASPPVPTIFSLARAAGFRTAASAHYWVMELADGPLTDGRTGRISGRNILQGYAYEGEDEPDSRVFALAKDFIRTGDPGLLVVLPGSVDAAGHKYGGTAAGYRRSATAVDAALADFFYFLSSQDYLAIVTTDHGHRNAGGHGGEERAVLEVPFLIFGPGVRPGEMKQPVSQLDIAPTIAAALNLPMAGSMGGRVMAEVFADPAPWQAGQERLAQAQASYLAANADLLGWRASASGQNFAQSWRGARRAALQARFYWRLPVALLLAAGIVLAGITMLRRLQWRWPVLAGLTFPLYFYAALRLLNADYSYSAMADASDFTIRAVLAALVSLVVLTWAGAGLRRGDESFFWPTSLGVWGVQTLLTVLAWLAVGGNVRRFLPDLGWHVFLMVQLLVTAIVSIYALAGWAVAQAVRRSPARMAR